MTIIWCIFTEIWSTTDNFLSFWTIFLPFYTPNNLKNQNFEKIKIKPADIIILHMCTINGNHMMYGSWDMKHDGQNFLSFWTIFSPFTPLTWKIKILKKWRNHLEILSFYTGISKITIIWCMIPDIWSVTMSCHFGLFFCPFTPLTTQKIKSLKKWKKKKKKNTWRYYHFTCVYNNWQSYDVWFLRYGVKRTKCFVILDHFLHFYTPNNPKNWNFEKIKIKPADIIILHMCTINGNHMMYGSWYMECDRMSCHFGPFFCPFTPLTTQKIKSLKKWEKKKKHLEVLSFYMCVP